MPLQRYVATVTLKPVTDGDRTFWHWESTFATPPGRERELREMVARDVYEAGFENLRRYLRDGGDRRGAGARADADRRCRCRRAAPSCARYGGPEVLQRRRRRGAGARAGRGAHPPARDRRQLPRRLPAPRLDPGDAAAAAACRAWRRPARCVDVGAGVSGLLPGDRVAYLGPLPGAYCSVRTVPADWVVRLPAAVEDDVAAAMLLKGITADYLLRDLGRVGAGHAAAGARRGRRRRPAACARGRAGSARRVIGTVSSEAKARVAREHGCEHVIVTRDYRFAEAVQRALRRRRRGRSTASATRRARRTSPRSRAAATGSASARPAARCSRSSPDRAGAEVDRRFSRPVVFDYVATPADAGRARAARVERAGRRRAQAPPIERHAARRRRRGARAARIAAHASARWC